MMNMTIAHVMTFRNTGSPPGTVARGLLPRVEQFVLPRRCPQHSSAIFADQSQLALPTIRRHLGIAGLTRGVSGELYLEDGLHRALRAALQQRSVLHVRVLELD